jgi:hypothetical protein
MKKIVLTMVAAMVAVVMDAQIYVGGAVGFQTVSHDGNSTTAFTLKPEAGYSFNEDWAVGMAFGYSESGKDESKVKTFIINPYVRYNAVKFDKVNLFLDGGLEYINTKYDSYKNNTFGIGVKPGISVALTDNLSIVSHMGFIGFKSSKPDFDGAKATNTFGVDLDTNHLDFGLYYSF